MQSNISPMYYLLGLGSNLSPERHIPEAMVRLLALSPCLWASASLVTPPSGMESRHYFINTAVIITTPLDPAALKLALNQLEIAMGRQRDHPQSHRRDRPIDIDILTQAEDQQQLLPPQISEPYLAQQIAQLLAALRGEVTALINCKPLTLEPYTLDCLPICLCRDLHRGFTLTCLEHPQ
jgi:2-amino-4-hydroxy-6-hydroxymethyldihydropteridine diphosphokinase